MSTKRMSARALKALKGSIKKWRKIVLGEGEDKGSANCPLCKAFPGVVCTGCPVKKKTGQANCGGTPFHTYRYAQYRDGPDSPAALAAAREEYDFLKGLLP